MPVNRKIIDVVDELENRIYLPAIQRSFVWKPDQIETLFDSLLQDYPIGTLLFWKIPQNRERNFALYKFIHDYDEKESVNDPLAEPWANANDITAVLDGQQRLTAFYIGMKGSSNSRNAENESPKDAISI